MARSWPHLNAILAHLGLQDASKSLQDASKTPSRPSKTPSGASKTSKTPPAGGPKTLFFLVKIMVLAVSLFSMIACSWTAFGMLFGVHLSSLGSLLESFWPSKAPLGRHLEALGHVLEPQRGSLGGPERLQELNLEAPSALGSSTWRPKAVQDTNLVAQSRSKSSTWRSKCLPKAFWHWKNIAKT